MQHRTLQCRSATSCDEFGHPNLSGLAAGTSCGQFGLNFPAVPFRYSGKFGFQIRPQLGTDLRKVPPNWSENRGQSMNSRTPGRLQTDSVRFTDAESTLVDNFCLDTIYSNAVNDRRRGKKYFTFLEVKAKPQSSTTTIRFQIDSGAHMQCATTALPQTAGASTPGTKHIHNEHVQQ